MQGKWERNFMQILWQRNRVFNLSPFASVVVLGLLQIIDGDLKNVSDTLKRIFSRHELELKECWKMSFKWIFVNCYGCLLVMSLESLSETEIKHSLCKKISTWE